MGPIASNFDPFLVFVGILLMFVFIEWINRPPDDPDSYA